jgi:hypothetical protein
LLAAGTTVKFTGSVPPQIFVRGACEIRGTIDCSAVDMPATVPTTGPLAGQRVSQYNAKGSPPSVLTMGQLGGLGGPGAGSGGNGGYEPGGTSGPIFILGVNISNGQAGQTVRVSASHAYAAQTVGTGGAGSPLTPASGLGSSATVPYITVLQYRRDFSRGGGGGGFMLAGGAPTLPTISPATLLQPVAGPAVAGGVLFALLPFPATPPPGYQSLNHFLVGGSGGGGGGAHNFSTANLLETAVGTMFVSGAGGTGGGGAIALRAGGDLTMFPTGSVLVRGGRGVVINGDDLASGTQDVNFGVSSPGGGGSGGSVLLQSAHDIAVSGLIDASGSTGSRTSNIAATSAPVEISVVSQAGAGSDGYYRLEAALGASFTGTGVPAFNPATNSGSLADVDARTGSRSLWLLPATSALPYWLRYELIADVGGQTLLFSDDPAVSPLAANDPAGAVQLRFQGARLDPVTGQPVASTIGPWRAQLAPSLSSVNGDRATAVRFDLVVDKSQGPVVVRELRLVWR